jgi:hypothetical protein
MRFLTHHMLRDSADRLPGKEALVHGADIVSTYLGITEQERMLAVLPFSFDAGLNQLTTSVAKGATCV